MLDILARPIRPLPPQLRPQYHNLGSAATARRRRLRRRPAVEVGRVAPPGLLLGRRLDHLPQCLEAVRQLGTPRELPDRGHLLRVSCKSQVSRVRLRVRAGAGAGV